MRTPSTLSSSPLILALTLCALPTACGSDTSSTHSDAIPSGADGGTDASTHDASGSADAGTPRDDVRVGEFGLKLVAPVAASGTVGATPGFTDLLGKLYDGPVPASTVWESDTEESGCVLRIPRVPFCEPGCGAGAVCVEDDQCLKSPAQLSAGTVTIEGVKTADGKTTLTVEPIRKNYLSSGLPYPAFEEGDAIKLVAAGADIEPFTIEGTGIAPLEMKSQGPYVLESGKPLALSWTAARSTGSRIQVKLDISHHGGSKGQIECDVDDDGALTIPAALVTKLKDLGVAGFPTVMVTRSQRSSAATARGRVDLRIYSYVEQGIEIPGLVSCSEDGDCSGGKTCQDDKTCG